MKIIYMDMDDVVIPLLPEWVRRYNKDWKDTLDWRNISEWDMTKFVKPECGKKIYDYLHHPHLYSNIAISQDTRQAIKYLQKYYRVVFISAGLHIGKYDLLKRYGLLDRDEDIVFSKDKGLFFGHYMVDDYYANLISFKNRNPNGKTILFDACHNQTVEQFERACDWDDVIHLIESSYYAI